MRLAGKVAIVTGAASGFGRGIAERFVAEGASVVFADVSAEQGSAVRDEVEAAFPQRTAFVTADVSTDAGTAVMVAAAVDRFGGLDIIVNNAGYSHRNMPMTEVDEDIYDRTFAVNMKSLFWAAKHAVPRLAERGGGSMLNTASTAGIRPRPGLTWYNASKGAVITATKSMAAELAPKNIRVNCLCPVLGQTGMTSTFLGEDTPERRAMFVATVPLGRMSTPADLAAAAVYLCSDEGSFITGAALEIDGGRCI